jgi:hypothetical protein
MSTDHWTPRIAKQAKEIVEKACRYHGWYVSLLQRSQLEHVCAEGIRWALAGGSVASLTPEEDDEGPGAA